MITVAQASEFPHSNRTFGNTRRRIGVIGDVHEHVFAPLFASSSHLRLEEGKQQVDLTISDFLCNNSCSCGQCLFIVCWFMTR